MTLKPSADGLTFDHPARYKIRVKGRIKENWSDRLEGMTILMQVSDEEPIICTLIGELPDQAALVGIFNALYELHLPLISVNCLNFLTTGESQSAID